MLRTVQVATPTPGPGQVLIRHEAIGVNFVDTQHHAGAPYPVELPLIPGIEAAAQVDGGGPGVEEIGEGDYNATRHALLGRAAAVFGSVLEGTLRPAIAASLPLTDAARAHELLDTREVIGKILLEP